MKKVIASVLSFATLALAADAPWWNAQWSMRMPVTVSTGMNPGKNALVSLKIGDPGQRSSIRVVDAENKEIPCAVRVDGSGAVFVAWRIAEPEMLEEMKYYVYWDKKAKPAVAEPEGFPKNLPGMNLIPNPEWQKKTPEGDIADWFCSSTGYGRMDKWNDSNRAKVSVEKKDGRLALKTSEKVVAFVKEIEEGHTYRMSFEGFNGEPQLTSVTALFYDHTNSTFKIHRQFGNYKIASGLSSPGSWIKSSNSSFGYIDNKTKTVHNNEKKVLPGTAGVYIEVFPRGQKPFWITALVFEDITENALDAKAGKPEERKK